MQNLQVKNYHRIPWSQDLQDNNSQNRPDNITQPTPTWQNILGNT